MRYLNVTHDMNAEFTPEALFDWRAALRKFSYDMMPRMAIAALASVLLVSCSVQDFAQKADVTAKASNIRGGSRYAYTTITRQLTTLPADRHVAVKRPAQLVGFSASPYVCSASGFGQKTRCFLRS